MKPRQVRADYGGEPVLAAWKRKTDAAFLAAENGAGDRAGDEVGAGGLELPQPGRQLRPVRELVEDLVVRDPCSDPFDVRRRSVGADCRNRHVPDNKTIRGSVRVLIWRLSEKMTDLRHSPIVLSVLGRVLAEARALIGRSPEQVGEATHLSGRTIRRLERGQIARPHRSTLAALAHFYALDATLLQQLVAWVQFDPASLLEALRHLDEGAPAEMGAVELAMRAARRGVDAGSRGPGGLHPDPEVASIIENFLALDRRRRTHVRLLLTDLRHAAELERTAAN